MTDHVNNRENSIRGYARETALCVDVPLSAIEEQIKAELKKANAEVSTALLRILKSVQNHRQLVERFTHSI